MKDFSSLLGNSRRYTLHSHTEFCDGRAQMEAFAREAVNRGFTHYGFTPHSLVPIVSPCNMHRDKVADYLAEYRRIVDTHGDTVTFLAGMEIDYLGPHWGATHEFFQRLPLDYLISSIHFVETRQGEPVDIDGRFEGFRRKMQEKFNGDIRYVVEEYYRRSIEMLQAGGFDILGHLDKIALNASLYSPGIEEEAWYRALVDEYIDKIISSGVTVELNTKSRADHGRFYPCPDILRRLLKAGVPIVVNSDAHVPALIDASRQEAFELIDSLL